MENIKKVLSNGLGKVFKALDAIELLNKDLTFKLEFKIIKHESGDKDETKKD